ncbi:hypothetical protein SSS_07649 [Sarcoptes scabiei]|nr:hypothetical protein SSS_07649 [Sarcoptes scabiei]
MKSYSCHNTSHNSLSIIVSNKSFRFESLVLKQLTSESKSEKRIAFNSIDEKNQINSSCFSIFDRNIVMSKTIILMENLYSFFFYIFTLFDYFFFVLCKHFHLHKQTKFSRCFDRCCFSLIILIVSTFFLCGFHP